ncbi:peptide deformylase [Serratia marcescens VGH107]|nr:peptide deformylase [Serratia marcescens VGH107]
MAAPQIGFPYRVIIINTKIFDSGRYNIDKNKPNNYNVYINPEINYLSSEEEADVEGCFSIPGFSGIVKRAKEATITAFDINGEKVTLKLTDFPARVFQHEIDHLNGLMYPDRIFSHNPDSRSFHFLSSHHATKEYKEEREKNYKSSLSSYKERHGDIINFTWIDTISKNEWEEKISKHKPNWNIN